MSEQTVDLARVGSALWRSRLRILAAAFVAAVLGFALTLLKPDEYTANSVLFVQDIRIGSMRVVQGEKETTPETFIGFLTNDYTLLRVIEELDLDVELRHVYAEPKYRDELIEARGRGTVPVLWIQSPDGEVRWMPESLDIIEYLRRMYGEKQVA